MSEDAWVVRACLCAFSVPHRLSRATAGEVALSSLLACCIRQVRERLAVNDTLTHTRTYTVGEV